MQTAGRSLIGDMSSQVDLLSTDEGLGLRDADAWWMSCAPLQAVKSES